MLREINIRPVLNGFIVQVGCQSLAYTDIDKMIVDLGHYVREPETTEKRILKEEGINRRHTFGGDTQVPVHVTDSESAVALAGYPAPPQVEGVNRYDSSLR